jgi:hypothetical protein
MRFRIRFRRAPGTHWKLMTATLAALTVTGLVAVMRECLAVGIAVLLGAATLAVQWFCIEVPEVQDEDLH